MARSIFGWSYPPGCSGPPDDYAGPCECCGQVIDDCICPECEACGDVGNPACYEANGHGLKYNLEQKMGVCLLEMYYIRERIAEDEWMIKEFFYRLNEEGEI